MVRDNTTTYGWLTKSLHWLIAIIILLQLLLGVSFDYLPSSWQMPAYSLHKSFGLLLLALAIIFVLWRMINPKPQYPATMKPWEKLLAYAVRISLYFLLIAMPLSGWIMSTAAGYPPQFFGLATIPAPFIPHSTPIASKAVELHELFAWIISILIALHFLAALKHAFINKDGIMRRMI